MSLGIKQTLSKWSFQCEQLRAQSRRQAAAQRVARSDFAISDQSPVGDLAYLLGPVGGTTSAPPREADKPCCSTMIRVASRLADGGGVFGSARHVPSAGSTHTRSSLARSAPSSCSRFNLATLARL
jgi:hypothetical protein